MADIFLEEINNLKKSRRSKAGRLGGLARAKLGASKLREISKKAAAKRLQKNPDAFREMGAKGGRISKGGGRKPTK